MIACVFDIDTYDIAVAILLDYGLTILKLSI